MADKAGLRGRFRPFGAPSPCSIGLEEAPAVAKRERRLLEAVLCSLRSKGDSWSGEDTSG